MKTLKTISLLMITFFTISCSNSNDTDPIPLPANFSEIELSDIIAKESKMSTETVIATTATGIQWEPGTVFVYKTSENNYGKLQLVSIDMSKNYAVTFKVTNFNSDGSINNSTSSFLVGGTSVADVDLFTTGGDSPLRDFHWNKLNSTDTNLVPKNGAKFYKYIF